MNGLVIAGTHSGCGKTTVTLGILAALKKKNYRVQPFKAGPDFIDAGLHRTITGSASRNLDLWMCGEDYIKDCIHEHSAGSDIAVVEGVMGMYDGNISTAHLAAALGLPVVLVVDAYGMAESASAIVRGFRDQGTGMGVTIAGLIFNRVGSERHYQRLKNSIQDMPVLGYLQRDLDFKIPHRHLGLIVAEEDPIGREEIDKLADAVLENINIDFLVRKCVSTEARKPIEKGLTGKALPAPASNPPNLHSCALKIGVAYDRAFCFYYEDNFDLLRTAGAAIETFSPLADRTVPEGLDALYIGGGYPELHAKDLSRNRSMIDSVQELSDSGMPVYAECGGFMYLTEGIYDLENIFHPMAGVFPFKTRMTRSRAGLGYREAVLDEDSILGQKGTILRGHEFHYSEITSPSPPYLRGSKGNFIYSVKDGSGNELHKEGYKVRDVLGSYIHVHFGSNPIIAGHLVNYIKEHHGTYSSGRTR
jgi:cobyrinic acid a,c-diamide synthase